VFRRLASGSAEHINNVRRRTSSEAKEAPQANDAKAAADNKLIEAEKVETGSVSSSQ